MVELWVRDAETWKISTPPATPAKRIWFRRNEQWDPIASISVRTTELVGGVQTPVWKTVKTWSPLTPTGVQVPSAQFNVHNQTTLGWTGVLGATTYEVKQNLWNTSVSAIESTTTRTAISTNLTVFSPVLENRNYSYEVRAVGSNGLASDWSVPYGYRNGQAATTKQVSRLGWGPEVGGITNWVAQSSTPVWDNTYTAQRAVDGTGKAASTWGWIEHQSYLVDATVSNEATNGQFWFRGNVYAYGYWPHLHIYPQERVYITAVQMQHYCLWGWKLHCAFGFDVFSWGRQKMALHRMRTNATTGAIEIIDSLVPDIWVDGDWPGNYNYAWDTATSQKLTANKELRGDLGEFLKFYFLEAAPVSGSGNGEGGLGPRWSGDSLPAQALPNLKWLDIWFKRWEHVAWDTVPDLPAVNSSTWVVP